MVHVGQVAAKLEVQGVVAKTAERDGRSWVFEYVFGFTSDRSDGANQGYGRLFDGNGTFNNGTDLLNFEASIPAHLGAGLHFKSLYGRGLASDQQNVAAA